MRNGYRSGHLPGRRGGSENDGSDDDDDDGLPVRKNRCNNQITTSMKVWHQSERNAVEEKEHSL